MSKVIPFEQLKNADLIKGTTYKGGAANNLSSEPISKLIPVGNQAGIRFNGSAEKPKIVVLYTTFRDPDWCDEVVNDKVIYYGDNKLPGREIHSLPGNQVLRSMFNNFYIHKNFPLILLFSKGDEGFDRIFHGVLKPGYIGMEETEDLIAIWKTKNGERFQNYRAIFTLLGIETIERKKLDLITS